MATAVLSVRSGRWAGRLVQLQNLYRNSMPDLEAARNLVREGDYDTVKMLYGAVPDVLAELVRTAFFMAMYFFTLLLASCWRSNSTSRSWGGAS